MKAYKVTFSHGHFIDKDTKKRIIPIQGEEYIITADEKAFSLEDVLNKTNDALTAEEKADWVLKKYGENQYGFLLQSGSTLYFNFGNNRRIKGDESKTFKFSCILLEDLYIYKLKKRPESEHESWRMVDCKCILDKCIEGNLTFTEAIIADSLNTLFNHTVMFYFERQRTSTCNVFSTFNLHEEYKENMFSIRVVSLNNLRIEWVKIYNARLFNEKLKKM